MTVGGSGFMARPDRAPFGRRVLTGLAALLVLMAAGGCGGNRELLFEGSTMGTTYQIKVVAGIWTRSAPIAADIEKTLEAVNASMSTYRPESEISRFNRFAEAGSPFNVSDDFYRVMTAGDELYRLTDGAWDGTLDPLIDRWGFGRTEKEQTIPPDADIQALLDRVGFDRIDITTPGALIKRHPDVTVDLASIAKGYGVDAVAQVIRDRGFRNFLVEIGGEVYAAGVRRDGTAWRVGINRPKVDAAYDAVYRVVSLTDRAFATSGDYRNFFEHGGRRYSHILDPRTGYPVANGVVSASVVAGTCTLADGLATALVVMGAEAGVRLVERLEGVECLIVVEESDGRLTDHYSSGLRFETL